MIAGKTTGDAAAKWYEPMTWLPRVKTTVETSLPANLLCFGWLKGAK